MGTLRLDDLVRQGRRAVQDRALHALKQAGQDAEWVVRYAVAAALEKLAVGYPAPEDGRAEAVALLVTLADIEREEAPVVRLRARLALNRLSSL